MSIESARWSHCAKQRGPRVERPVDLGGLPSTHVNGPSSCSARSASCSPLLIPDDESSWCRGHSLERPRTERGTLQCQPTLGARPSCLGRRASTARPLPRGRAPAPDAQAVESPVPAVRRRLGRKQRAGHRPTRLTTGGARAPWRPPSRRPKPTVRRPPRVTRSDTLRRQGVTFREWVLLGVRAPDPGLPSTEADFRPGVFHHLVARSRSSSPPHSPLLSGEPVIRGA